MNDMDKNYIKDIGSNELQSFDNKLKSWKELTDLSWELDRRAEGTFSDWLKTQANKDINAGNKEDYELSFNNELDKKIDDLQYQEILEEEDVVRDELIALNFEIELSSFQQDLQNDIEEQRQEEAIDVNIGKINIKKINITDQEILDIQTKLNNNVFDSNSKVKEIVELLEKSGPEESRKIQYILIGKDYVQGEKVKEPPLVKHGTDGLFWPETLSALNSYLDENIVKDISPNPSPVPTSTVEAVEEELVQEGIVTGLDNAWNGVEVISGGEIYVSLEEGKEQILKKNLSSDTTIETIPPSNMLWWLRIENGDLIYKWENSGQETLRVILRDASWSEIYNNVITFDINGPEWLEDEDNDGSINKYDKFVYNLERTGNIKSEIDLIVAEMEKEKVDYMKLLELQKEELKNKSPKDEEKIKELEEKIKESKSYVE